MVPPATPLSGGGAREVILPIRPYLRPGRSYRGLPQLKMCAMAMFILAAPTNLCSISFRFQVMTKKLIGWLCVGSNTSYTTYAHISSKKGPREVFYSLKCLNVHNDHVYISCTNQLMIYLLPFSSYGQKTDFGPVNQ